MLSFVFVHGATAFAKESVSYYRDIVPVLTANCQACHRPDKTKGNLDLTTFESFKKGGKRGIAFSPGSLKSTVLEQIRGDKPKMPPDGDPLKKEEVAAFERWIKEGAKEDAPLDASRFRVVSYKAAPVVTALAYSPDGATLAVSGYSEVLLHKSDGSGLVARLPGDARRAPCPTSARRPNRRSPRPRPSLVRPSRR